MLDGVLDERLNAHGGNGTAAAAGIDVEGDVQAFAEAGLLHAQVGGGEFDFLAERHPLVLGFPQRIAEHLRQLLDGFVGQLRLILNQAGDGVQRVEQEVRIDLGAQGFQLGAAGQPAELLFAFCLSWRRNARFSSTTARVRASDCSRRRSSLRNGMEFGRGESARIPSARLAQRGQLAVPPGAGTPPAEVETGRPPAPGRCPPGWRTRASAVLLRWRRLESRG